MKRRQGHQLLEPRHHLGVDQNGGRVPAPAMHDAVPCGHQSIVAAVLPQPRADLVHRAPVIRAPLAGQVAVDERLAPGSAHNEVRACADAVNLSVGPGLERLPPADVKDRELDAR